MLILGIESSCDETAAAVVDETGRVLSDVVRSQVEEHAPYGGVVPEIASRNHARLIVPVVERALEDAACTIEDVDGVAVTNRPGLSGALLVGLQAAKGLAWAADKPIVGVDHLIGHVLAVFLRRDGGAQASRPEFPFVALLASGGHTGLYRVDGPLASEMRELGGTRDDAAGEAFDKVAKLLGLGYPGGPVVDRLAAQGDPDRAAHVPRPMTRHGLEFSFSGIKSALARYVEQHGVPAGQPLADLCAAFQRAVVETLARKAVRAAEQEGLARIVLGGGVAANRGLRARAHELGAARGIEVFIPPLASCTDNAAMIAYAGAQRLAAGERDDMRLAPATVTLLPRVTRKGPGQRRLA